VKIIRLSHKQNNIYIEKSNLFLQQLKYDSASIQGIRIIGVQFNSAEISLWRERSHYHSICHWKDKWWDRFVFFGSRI